MRFLFKLAFLLVLACTDNAALAQNSARAWGEKLIMELDHGLLRDLGITIQSSQAITLKNNTRVEFSANQGAGLGFLAQGSDFRGLKGGMLTFESALTFRFKNEQLVLSELRLVPGKEPLSFELLDADNHRVFYADHMHHDFNRAAGRLAFNFMDLHLSAWLARRIGQADHAGTSLGMLALKTSFDVPAGSVKGRPQACRNPRWSPGVDVATTAITQVQQTGAIENGEVVITPGAFLVNAGLAEVPWISAFETPGGPYNNDQHPYLVWSIYKTHDGALRQLGYSDVKHAFNAVNIDCPCPSGNVLWSAVHPDNNGSPCRDFYGVSTNRMNEWLGPRDEITAHLGTWDHCGSHFDASPVDCQRDHDGANEDGEQHGLHVPESVLEDDAAVYWFEAWYLVRDDVNPDNNLAHVQVNPSKPGEAWVFDQDPTINGPAIESWIAAASSQMLTRVDTLNTAFGRLRLAVRVDALDNGRYQYRYALMNFTFDPQVDSFAITLPSDVVPDEIIFFDSDQKTSNNWTSHVENGRLRWQVRDAASANTLDWGMLFSFGFESDTAPVSTGARLLSVEGNANPVYFMETLGPASDVIFTDGFDPQQINAVSTNEAAR